MTRSYRRHLTSAALALAGLVFFLAAAPDAQAVINNGGGGGQGFSCDVNTTECTCVGSWEGADCQAMSKNCDFTGSVLKSCDAKGCRCWTKPAGNPPARTGGKSGVKVLKQQPKLLSQ